MYYAVFDVGGSALKFALMNEKGEFLEEGIIKTPKDNLDEFIETIGSIVDSFKEKQIIFYFCKSITNS